VVARDEERVALEVLESVSIGFGITLVPGVYIGKRGRNWMGAQYLLELTAKEIGNLGGTVTPGTDKSLYDVSKFVRSGNIEVF
jgi:hypothetical protein